MKQSFTKNLLVKYIYNETSTAERLNIEAALNEDFELYEEYVALYEAYINLPKVKFTPSPKSISNILSYSKESNAFAIR